MRRLSFLLLALALVLVPFSVSAATVTYTFDSSLDGWTLLHNPGGVTWNSGTQSMRVDHGVSTAWAVSPVRSKSAGRAVEFSADIVISGDGVKQIRVANSSHSVVEPSACGINLSGYSVGSHSISFVCDMSAIQALTSYHVVVTTAASGSGYTLFDNVTITDIDPPAATSTPTPVPTNTDVPTNTPVPATATPTPTETNTPVPATETATLVPTETFTPVPTNTDVPTNTPVPATNTPTNTPVPIDTATPIPSATYFPTPTVGPTSTPYVGPMSLGMTRANVLSASGLFFAGVGSLFALILGLAVGRRVLAYIKGLLR